MSRISLTTTILAATMAVIQGPVPGIAQRAFEKDAHVIFEDATRKQTDLGRAFNPILTRDGKVVMIRGPRIEFGDKIDCSDPEGPTEIICRN